MASKPINRTEPFEINHNVSGEPLNINHSNAKSEETCQSHSLVVNEARKKSESTQYSTSTISKLEKPKDKFGSDPSTLPANARVLPTNKKSNSHPQMVKKAGKNSESTEYPMCIISKHEKPEDTCTSNPSISPGNTRAMATNAKTNSHPQMVNKAEKNSESTQYLMCSISKPEKPKGTIASDPSISSGNTRALQTNAKTNSHPQMVNKDGKNSESTEYLMCRISKPEKPEGTFASDPSISSGNTRTLPTNAETNNSHPQIVNKVGKNSESTEYLMNSISKPEKAEGTFASDPSISSGNTRALSTNTKTTSHSQMVNKDGKNYESAEYQMCSISKPEKPEGTFVSDSSISPGNTRVLLTNAKENRRPQMVNKDGKKSELNEYSMCTTSKLEKPKVTFTSDLSTSPRNTRVLPTKAKTNGHPQMVNKDGKLSETTEYSTCIISKPEKLKDTFASDPSTSPGNTKALPTNTKTNGHSQMVNKVGEMSESTEYSMSTISKPEKPKGIFASDPSTSPGNTRALLANAKTNSHLQIVHKTGKNFESIEDTFASNPSISPGNIRPTNAKANSYGQGCSNSSPSNSLDSTGPPIKPHTGGDARWDAIQMVSRGTPLNLSHFRVLKRIGRGDIGSVHLVELKRTKAYFAMKVMDKASLASRNKPLRAQAEREILQLLDHPFLPTLYAYLETDKYHCLVMEFCSGGDLHSLRQKQPNKYFTEEAARFYVSEILLAIEYLHMLGIVYRDLKPENVLVRDEGHIMLSDFDLSLRCSVSPTVVKSSHTNASNNGSGSIIEDDNAVQGVVQQQTFFPRILPLKKTRKSKSDFGQAPGGSLPELVAEPKNVRSMSFVGTHEYLAPEIIRNEGHGSAVDWWTFGIFLYELLHGATPFKGSGNRDTLINVIGQPLKFPEAPHVSSAAKDLIKKLLVKEPKKRIAYTRGATEIKQHPFFEGVNWALVRSALPPHVPEPVDFSQYASKEALSPKDKKMIEVVKDQNKHSADDSYIDFEYF